MSQTCSRCGAEIPEGHAICPTCGASVPKPQRYVRCSHCLHRAPAGLTVCPHCGRTLRPWRADKWVLSLSLLTLVGLWLFFGNGFAVVTRAGDALGALLPPAITPVTAVATAPTATATTLVHPTDTAIVAASPTPLPTEAPTATPYDTATPTASPAPTATVVADTVVSTASPTPAPQPTDTATPEPTATATATATVTPSPTPKPQSDVVVVQAGDTLSGIAQKVNRSIAALAAYNNITDPTTIRVGQELKIPPADYVPPTPTPKRPTKTPTPTPTATPSISLPAPVLINPGNESTFSGQKALIELKWQSLPTGLPSGAEYVVHIGVLVGPNDISWRMAEPVGSQTSFYAPEWLFGQAPQDYGRAYVWYIQAAMVTRNGDQVTTIPISQPSETRKFYWN